MDLESKAARVARKVDSFKYCFVYCFILQQDSIIWCLVGLEDKLKFDCRENCVYKRNRRCNIDGTTQEPDKSLMFQDFAGCKTEH